MGRPRKHLSETFYDVFSDMPVDEQTIALRIMQEIHRQLRRGRPVITTTTVEMQDVVNANLRQIRQVTETTPEDQIEDCLEKSLAMVKG